MTRCRKVKRIGVAVLIAMAALALLAAAAQGMATASDARRFPPPGRLVDVGGRSLHVICAGKGEPVVILETGVLSFSLAWSWIQPRVAEVTTVCAYDRAGYGWSDPPPRPATAEHHADDLRALLSALHVRGPVVLVGHSYGAFVARVFAAHHPDQVAAMVLLDPAHPSQEDRARCDPACLPAALLENEGRIYRVTPVLARFGVLRVLHRAGLNLFSLVSRFPPSVQPALIAQLSTTQHWLTAKDEVAHFSESAEQARALRSLGDEPLRVVVADSTWTQQSDGYRLPAGIDGVALDRTIRILDEDNLELSSDARLVVVRGAMHVSLVTSQHDAAAVAEEIRSVVETLRAGPRVQIPRSQ